MGKYCIRIQSLKVHKHEIFLFFYLNLNFDVRTFLRWLREQWAYAEPIICWEISKKNFVKNSLWPFPLDRILDDFLKFRLLIGTWNRDVRQETEWGRQGTEKWDRKQRTVDNDLRQGTEDGRQGTEDGRQGWPTVCGCGGLGLEGGATRPPTPQTDRMTDTEWEGGLGLGGGATTPPRHWLIGWPSVCGRKGWVYGEVWPHPHATDW